MSQEHPISVARILEGESGSPPAVGWVKIYHDELLPDEPVIEGQIGQPGAESLHILRQRYLPIIRSFGLATEDLRVLELGAGFGRLTYAFIQELSPRYYIATEPFVSLLQVLRKNLDAWGYAWPKGIVAAYDANSPSTIRPGAVNLVVGNAVLHHILAYQQCLTHLTEILDRPGLMMFVEPIHEAWAYWVTVVKSVLFAARGAGARLALSDKTRMMLQRHAQNLENRMSRKQDLAFLSTLEDKHFFSLPDLMEFAERNRLRFHCQKAGMDWLFLAKRRLDALSIEPKDADQICAFIAEVMPAGLGDTLMQEFTMTVCFYKE